MFVFSARTLMRFVDQIEYRKMFDFQSCSSTTNRNNKSSPICKEKLCRKSEKWLTFVNGTICVLCMRSKSHDFAKTYCTAYRVCVCMRRSKRIRKVNMCWGASFFSTKPNRTNRNQKSMESTIMQRKVTCPFDFTNHEHRIKCGTT